MHKTWLTSGQRLRELRAVIGFDRCETLLIGMVSEVFALVHCSAVLGQVKKEPERKQVSRALGALFSSCLSVTSRACESEQRFSSCRL